MWKKMIKAYARLGKAKLRKLEASAALAVTNGLVGHARRRLASSNWQPPVGESAARREAVTYLTEHPALEHRRLRLSGPDVTQLLMIALHQQREIPVSVLSRSMFVWSGTETGEPTLCVITPGLEG